MQCCLSWGIFNKDKEYPSTVEFRKSIDADRKPGCLPNTSRYQLEANIYLRDGTHFHRTELRLPISLNCKLDGSNYRKKE